MRVFKIFVDLDKEEQYLRDMARKGYLFVRYTASCKYVFEAAKPVELNYRVDYRYFSSSARFEEYLTLFDDAGWMHIGGTMLSGVHYFLPKPGVEQTVDIFSDSASKAARHKRVALVYLGIVFLYAVTLFPCLAAFLKEPGWLFRDFHTWYFTPGLWERTGADFWLAFCIETPFVIIRTGILSIPLLLVMIVFGWWSLKFWHLYRKRK
jgi:hypothetical protein